MDGLILETTVLIDLEREALAGVEGGASRFLAEHPDARLFITVVTAGELACGPRVSERESWSTLVGRFDVLGIGVDACWRYGRAFRYLRENGMLIGTNDLWIAAIALAEELPVLTRNQAHFRRVPGLEVLGYG